MAPRYLCKENPRAFTERNLLVTPAQKLVAFVAGYSDAAQCQNRDNGGFPAAQYSPPKVGNVQVLLKFYHVY
jgi:hypothetical protein